jgi:uncharacterized UBP type Zn finger protein
MNTTKWYEFRQNNSGGSFDIDGEIGKIVIIEAESADMANSFAESIGIYFNGVQKGYDCECCGSRWHKANEWDVVENPGTGNEDMRIYPMSYFES